MVLRTLFIAARRLVLTFSRRICDQAGSCSEYLSTSCRLPPTTPRTPLLTPRAAIRILPFAFVPAMERGRRRLNWALDRSKPPNAACRSSKNEWLRNRSTRRNLPSFVPQAAAFAFELADRHRPSSVLNARQCGRCCCAQDLGPRVPFQWLSRHGCFMAGTLDACNCDCRACAGRLTE